MKTIFAIRCFGAIAVALLAISCSENPTNLETGHIETPIDLFDREEAAQYLLDNLPLESSQSVEIRLLRIILNPGDTITENGTSFRHTADSFEWFALIDHAPGAFFEHPLEYITLDCKTRELTKSHRRNLPYKNGTPIWSTSLRYQNSDMLIYSRYSNHVIDTKRSISDLIENAPPKNRFDNCPYSKRHFAILMTNFSGPGIMSIESEENIENLAEAFRKNGYEVARFADHYDEDVSHPYLFFGDERGRGLYQLRHFVKKHQDKLDCCEEIVVYLTGQTGIAPDRYGPRAYFDLGFWYSGESETRTPQKRLLPQDLVSIFKPLESCHLNFVIDASHAGGFVKPLSRLRQCETVIASCQLRELAYRGAFDKLTASDETDYYGFAHGESGSEFTSSFAKRIDSHSDSLAPNFSPTAGHEIISIGFEGVMANDFAFNIGKTLPFGIARDKKSLCKHAIDSSARDQALATK